MKLLLSLLFFLLFTIDVFASSICQNEVAFFEKVSSEMKAGDRGAIHSFLVERSGERKWTSYFRGFTEDKIQTMQSTTKSISSLAYGIGLDKNLLPPLNTSLFEIFSDDYGSIMSDDYKKITVGHILSMTAGIKWSQENYEDSIAMNKSGDWLAYVLQKEVTHEPGKTFNYSDGQSLIIAGIVFKATGISLDQFTEIHLFKPLGIKDFEWESQGPIAQSAWGLSLSPESMMKIGNLILNQGRFGDQQIVSKSWIHESTRPKVKTSPQSLLQYSYQWWWHPVLFKGGLGEAKIALGRGGQVIVVIPEAEVVLVSTGWNTDGDFSEVFTLVTEYLSVLNQC